MAGPEPDPRLGIVVVDWNAAELVSQCLEAIGRQTLRPHRVVVIDNASPSATFRHVGRLPLRLDMVRLPENRGFAAACNLGATLLTDCDLVALVNPDAFLEPHWVDVMLRAARGHPRCASFASRLVSAEDSGVLDGTGDVYGVTGLAWRRDHGASAAGWRTEPDEVLGPCAAAAVYRRDEFLEAGGFDESYFCYFEDVDLALRLRLAGHGCLYVPGAVARHIGSATTGRHSDFSVYHAHRNLVWTFVKDIPNPLFALYLPLHLAFNVTSGLHFATQKQSRAILRAKRDALRGLPHVLRARRVVQSRRRISAWELRRFLVGGLRAFGWGRFGS